MRRQEALEHLLEAASEQGGYVTTGQASRLGVTAPDLDRLVRSGDLRRVRRSVYAMRHAQPTHEDEIAAWLSLQRERFPWEDTPDAVLSHDSAAALFGLGTLIPMLPVLTVRSDARRYSSADDIVVHRAPLRVEDWVWHDTGSLRLPVTSPARTIVDLILDKQEPSYIARATREALLAGISSPEQLLEAARHRKTRTAALEAKAAALLRSAA